MSQAFPIPYLQEEQTELFLDHWIEETDCGPAMTADVRVLLRSPRGPYLFPFEIRESLPYGAQLIEVQGAAVPTPTESLVSGGRRELAFRWARPPVFPIEFTYHIYSTQPFGDGAAIRGYATGTADEGEIVETGDQAWLECQASHLHPLRFLPFRNAYVPGGYLYITLELHTPEYAQISVMSFVEHLPEGWRFAGFLGGDCPELAAFSEVNASIEFVWIFMPAQPPVFTYKVFVPATAIGTARIWGRCIYRTDAGESQSVIEETFIPQSSLVEIRTCPLPTEGEPIIGAMIRAFDRNGDGGVSLAEAREAHPTTVGLDWLFDNWDTNGNGTLHPDEDNLVPLAHTLVQHADTDGDGIIRYAEVLDYLTIKAFELLDRNDDWLFDCRDLLEEPESSLCGFPEDWPLLVDWWWPFVDRNGDERVTPAEFRRVWHDAAATATAFETTDTDGDGSLSRPEVLAQEPNKEHVFDYVDQYRDGVILYSEVTADIDPGPWLELDRNEDVVLDCHDFDL